jgi:hypothetical protein
MCANPAVTCLFGGRRLCVLLQHLVFSLLTAPARRPFALLSCPLDNNNATWLKKIHRSHLTITNPHPVGSCLPPYAWGFAVVLRHTTTQRPWDLLLLPWKTTTNTTPIRPPPPPPPTRTAAHDTTILPTMTTPIRHRRLPQRLPQRLTPRSTKNPSMTF